MKKHKQKKKKKKKKKEELALREFVTHLRIPKKDKDLLNQLTPANYIGLAPKLVDQA